MHKRRSLFVTGVLLSALVLFGTTTVGAQVDGSGGVDFAAGVTAAVALDHDSIRLRWAVTGSEIENITGFEIRYQASTEMDEYDPDEASMFAKAADDATSVVVDGLKHSTWYVFQVRAEDTKGIAAERSDPTSWNPTDLAAPARAMTDVAEAPEQVDDLELVAGNMMIMATWDEADTDKNFPLTGYEVKITPKDGNTNTMNIGVMEAYTFENLMNGTEYTVQVAARNEVELGDYSDEEKATPMAGGATQTPALPVFGAFALGAGLLAAGRRRLRRRQQLLNS